MNNSYKQIANHYKEKFDQFGATPKGLDWDNRTNMDRRHKVMLEFIQSNPDQNGRRESVLDFGCGYGDFYEFYFKNFFKSFHYTGIDINENCINKARELHPEISWGLFDIHDPKNEPFFYRESLFPKYDYIICNGTFTVKNTLTQEEMTNFMCSTLEKLWEKTNKGIAFNCMSKVLDYERDDLFHVSFDELSMWVYDNLSDKFVIRQDYGLREFTMYVYK